MCAIQLVLSIINNLKSVRFFKLVLRYDYSIVLYVSGMHNAVVLYIYICLSECFATLMLKCNSGCNNSYRLSCTTVKQMQLVQYNVQGQ